MMFLGDTSTALFLYTWMTYWCTPGILRSTSHIHLRAACRAHASQAAQAVYQTLQMYFCYDLHQLSRSCQVTKGDHHGPLQNKSHSEWPDPTGTPAQCKTQLKGLLGLANFHRRMVHHFAEPGAPLNALTAEKTEWVWHSATLHEAYMCET